MADDIENDSIELSSQSEKKTVSFDEDFYLASKYKEKSKGGRLVKTLMEIEILWSEAALGRQIRSLYLFRHHWVRDLR